MTMLNPFWSQTKPESKPMTVERLDIYQAAKKCEMPWQDLREAFFSGRTQNLVKRDDGGKLYVYSSDIQELKEVFAKYQPGPVTVIKPVVARATVEAAAAGNEAGQWLSARQLADRLGITYDKLCAFRNNTHNGKTYHGMKWPRQKMLTRGSKYKREYCVTLTVENAFRKELAKVENRNFQVQQYKQKLAIALDKVPSRALLANQEVTTAGGASLTYSTVAKELAEAGEQSAALWILKNKL
jgi:hypothetical protein